MADTPTTTRPSRARKATPAKAAPTAAKAAAAAPEEPTRTEVTRTKIELEHLEDTKSYSKFKVPENLRGTVVGQIYAPLGTARVGVVIINSDDTEE